MMTNIALEIAGSLSGKGFSLDELVFKTRQLFEENGFPGFLSLWLMVMDETICLDLVRREGPWRPPACCVSPRYELHDRLERRFRTSLGEVSIRWRRVRCVRCGRTCVPLRTFLGLERYVSHTGELERIVSEVMSEQSYRRGSAHLQLIGEIPVPKSTAHRWVMESPCDEIGPYQETFDFLMADGTGFKRTGRSREERGPGGELRMAVGVTSQGRVVPLGAWSEKSWEEIGKAIRPPEDAAGRKAESMSRCLVSDGEAGLVEGLGSLTEDQQRCHWHLVRDIKVLMWKDHATKKEWHEMRHRLAGIIGIELPAEDFEQVRDEDKDQLRQSTLEAEGKLDEVIVELTTKGYPKAAAYVRNAKRRLFSYVRFWLENGLVSPRVSSMIERMMREITRRLKRIAFGWSDKGATKMARIILKRITNAGQWDSYWKNRLRIDENNVMLWFRGAKII
jgi:hypothetical protein